MALPYFERGVWSLSTYPDVVRLGRAQFRKAGSIQQPYEGVVVQYREDIAENSRHMKVYADGTFTIDHVDRTNPDRGVFAAIKHFFQDHPWGKPVAFGLGAAAVIGVVAVVARKKK